MTTFLDYWQAWDKFLESYQDEEKEINIIKSFINFRGRKILDMGAGPGRLSIKFAPLSSVLVALDINEKLLVKFKKMTKRIGLFHRTSPIIGDCLALMFKNNSFDITYTAWVLQSVRGINKVVEEMVRVTKLGGSIIIVLASEEGDETKIRSIFEPKEIENRKKRIELIKKILEKNGCRVIEIRIPLNFHFQPSVEETYEILNWITFNGRKLPENIKLRVKNYLKVKLQTDKILFTQGTSFICGHR